MVVIKAGQGLAIHGEPIRTKSSLNRASRRFDSPNRGLTEPVGAVPNVVEFKSRCDRANRSSGSSYRGSAELVGGRLTSGENWRGSPGPDKWRRGSSEPRQTWLPPKQVVPKVRTPLGGFDRDRLGFNNVV
ncbi:hypothetical protein Acr_29g0007740 [Actinidia rufa]|uniref:Uncharacterized protein n=1 Tax=Actinidia rufa TaxID=165716 RepID=A0A7J0HEZ1_9ERIC|nr:hypothetical protein Acr_29g0007740 [Actinidia rufa]